MLVVVRSSALRYSRRDEVVVRLLHRPTTRPIVGLLLHVSIEVLNVLHGLTIIVGLLHLLLLGNYLIFFIAAAFIAGQA